MNIELVLKPLVSEATKSIFSFLSAKVGKHRSSPDELGPRLRSHLIEVANWAGQIQFYGMTSAKDTKTQTVPLTIDTIPRKFRGSRKGTKKVVEGDLLSETQDYIILGDPGSGKTTTIKRLANTILYEEPSSAGDRWQFPVVVRLRNVDSKLPLHVHIAENLGIAYEEASSLDKHKLSKEARKFISKGFGEFVGSMPLEILIPEVLDSVGAILFLDGLDEVPIENRAALTKSIERLALRSAQTKIVISCRSGDYSQNLEGFSVVELCPLDSQQIRQIVTKWISRYDEFLEKIQKKPYLELAARPLFLCQLIVLYRNTEYLPERPSGVYQMLTRLLLEDWDRRRSVKRRSKYADFNPDNKMEFLAALSYHLTFRVKTTRFTHSDLVTAYTALHQLFQLPLAEARDVVGEIETHTGIIAESGADHYEFSHLSLQEYLCAHYLVREPFADHLVDYMEGYPAPVAVAIALAPTASNWFANVVLSRAAPRNPIAINSFLSRLNQERPRFTSSLQLGYAFVKLFSVYGDEIVDNVKILITNEAVLSSLELALKDYWIDFRKSGHGKYRIEKIGRELTKGVGVLPPLDGVLTEAALELFRGYKIRVSRRGPNAKRGRFIFG